MSSSPSSPHQQQDDHEHEIPKSPQGPITTQNPNPIPIPNTQTLTLETPIKTNPLDQNPIQDKPDPQQLEPIIEVETEEQEDPGEPEPEHSAAPASSVAGKRPSSSTFRRGLKRKKGSFKNKAKQASIERKLNTLLHNLNPIVFVPNKNLDFAKHEENLRRIGLWEFAHLEFDDYVRGDLVAQLIVSYNVGSRCGYVNESRVLVNRAALARALCLPVGKKGVTPDLAVEKWPEEFLLFLDEFVSNWMLLHEDTWVLPVEVVNWMRAIKEGNLEKVDWAGLMWFMMEKELAQGQHLVNCYYASHFHQLIKVQKEELLKSSVRVVDDDFGVDVKMGGSDETFARPDSGEQITELSLGHMEGLDLKISNAVHGVDKGSYPDNVEDVGDADKVGNIGCADNQVDATNIVEMQDVDDGNHDDDDDGNHDDDDAEKEGVDGERMMNLDDCTGKEPAEFLLDGESNAGGHILQRCSMANAKVNDDQGQFPGYSDAFEDNVVEENQQVDDFSSMQRSSCFDGLSSENLIEGMESIPLPFASDLCIPPSSLEPPARIAGHGLMLGGSSMFSKAVKREIDHNHDMSHPAMNEDYKRARVGSYMDHSPEDFESCMDQLQHWGRKARIAYETVKEESRQQENMMQEYLASELANKDNMILHLKCKIDELQSRRQAETNRYDNELFVMSRLVDGYRKALKDTQRAFAEYREKCPQLDEPIYKDAGPGGVVKSVTELEMERLKREEEERMMRTMAETMLANFEMEWESKFNGHIADFDMWSARFSDLKKEVDLLKEIFAKRKAEAHVSDLKEISAKGDGEEHVSDT